MEQNKQVALISMPFYLNKVPNLGISILKACLNNHNIACDNYYFDQRARSLIDFPIYSFLCLVNIGEWFFTSILFENFDNSSWSSCDVDTEKIIEKILKERDRAAEILENFYAETNWGQYQIIGFSTTFFQTTASLALAKKIKSSHPNVTIIFGGANCDGEMGLELHRQFPFIDLVVPGEGDLVLPQLAKRILNNQSIADVGRVIYRDENGKSIQRSTTPISMVSLDNLPFPDFGDFFNKYPLDTNEWFPVEFSRGCWWGERKHCTFCGFNGTQMTFRAKSADRIFAELDFLSSEYGITRFLVTDKVLKKSLFSELFPRIGSERPQWKLVLEARPNLSKEEVERLHKANVQGIGAGIESLITEHLKSLNKGHVGLQNVQLLKWCSEIGVNINWNWLYNIPYETPEEYARMKAVIPHLLHLMPPISCHPVKLSRFSPLFYQPEKFGIKNIRLTPADKLIYPFPEDETSRLVHYFDYDYMDGRNLSEYIPDFKKIIEFWRENYSPGSLTSTNIGSKLIVIDTRPEKEKHRYEFENVQKTVLEYCDRLHTFQSIRKHIEENGFNPSPAELQEILNKFIQDGLMLQEGHWYLSLIVSRDAAISQLSTSKEIKLAILEAIS